MKLKELRKSLNLTQAEVAKALNLTDKTYGNYENGNTDPTINTLINLADYFHISIDELIGREHDNYIDKGLLSNTELNIIEIMKKLTPAKIEKLESYAVALLETQEDERIIIEKFRNRR